MCHCREKARYRKVKVFNDDLFRRTSHCIWIYPFTTVLLLLDGVGHEPLLGALGAEDVLVVGDEPLADHGGLAGGAEEAVVVPVPALERDEARAPDA